MAVQPNDDDGPNSRRHSLPPSTRYHNPPGRCPQTTTHPRYRRARSSASCSIWSSLALSLHYTGSLLGWPQVAVATLLCALKRCSSSWPRLECSAKGQQTLPPSADSNLALRRRILFRAQEQEHLLTPPRLRDSFFEHLCQRLVEATNRHCQPHLLSNCNQKTRFAYVWLPPSQLSSPRCSSVSFEFMHFFYRRTRTESLFATQQIEAYRHPGVLLSLRAADVGPRAYSVSFNAIPDRLAVDLTRTESPPSSLRLAYREPGTSVGGLIAATQRGDDENLLAC
uniref:Uncharacterized protein n=1 Tax=Mycena chlorophos TaxID=658473 RepID=A0ABQ0M0V1_MYCCL|nr:predicted protein [Mycena chlorophos]